MGFITAVSATGLAAGLVFTGVHFAAASSGAAPASASSATSSSSTSTGLTLPPGGVLEQRVTNLCKRSPQLIQRADKASTRLAADAKTKGSLARAKARQAKAEENHHPAVAKRLDRVIDRRTKRLARLPELKQKLTAAQGECTTIGLPTTTPATTPSATPSATTPTVTPTVVPTDS